MFSRSEHESRCKRTFPNAPRAFGKASFQFWEKLKLELFLYPKEKVVGFLLFYFPFQLKPMKAGT